MKIKTVLSILLGACVGLVFPTIVAPFVVYRGFSGLVMYYLMCMTAGVSVVLLTWGFLYYERKQGRQKKVYEENLLLFKTIFEQSPLSIIVTDIEGTITKVNQKACVETGYPGDELIGHNPRLLKTGKIPDEVYVQLWETISKGGVWEGELLNKRKDGSEYWEKAVISPIKTADNTITGYLGLKDNITDRKKIEIYRSNAEKMMRHDLKTPLHAIINIPELIASDPNITDGQRKSLRHIKESGEYMLNQIEQSLELYRLESKNYTAEEKAVNVLQVLEKLKADLVYITDEHSLSIVFEYSGSVHEGEQILITSDPHLFYRMMSNIVKNAIEGSYDGDTITIRLHKESFLLIEVHNRKAIPVEIRHSFFDKFVSYNKKGGNGLGAYSSRVIARTLRGDITFKTGVDFGTSVFIHLPL